MKSIPPQVKWKQEDSGSISVRLNKTSAHNRAALLFQNGPLYGFSVMIETIRDRVLVCVFANLTTSEMEQSDYDLLHGRSGLLRWQDLWTEDQQTDQDKMIPLSVTTSMKHHGALIWITMG
jgi:hypothetical protein